MVAKGKANSAAEVVPAEAKIARLMGLSAISGLPTVVEKCVFLRAAGFTNPEIGAMLNMTNNQVAVAFVASRKKKRKKRA